jgi:hypothetical protein
MPYSDLTTAGFNPFMVEGSLIISSKSLLTMPA